MEQKNNQVAKQEQTNQMLSICGNEYRPLLINAMEQGDKQAVNLILRQFKDEYGNVNFPMVVSVPTSERLPALAKKDFTHILKLIIGAITVALENVNIKKGLNEIQILDLSEHILDSANEDNLSFEDLMLFLQKMTRGDYKIPDPMDIPKFMSMFEIYREERHQKYIEYKMEQHYGFKNMGDGNRSTKSDPLSEHFASMGERMTELKRTISNLKQENSSLKMDNL